MPLMSFDRILKIILIILNVLSAALRAFDVNPDLVDPDDVDPTGSA